VKPKRSVGVSRGKKTYVRWGNRILQELRKDILLETGREHKERKLAVL